MALGSWTWTPGGGMGGLMVVHGIVVVPHAKAATWDSTDRALRGVGARRSRCAGPRRADRRHRRARRARQCHDPLAGRRAGRGALAREPRRRDGRRPLGRDDLDTDRRALRNPGSPPKRTARIEVTSPASAPCPGWCWGLTAWSRTNRRSLEPGAAEPPLSGQSASDPEPSRYAAVSSCPPLDGSVVVLGAGEADGSGLAAETTADGTAHEEQRGQRRRQDASGACRSASARPPWPPRTSARPAGVD